MGDHGLGPQEGDRYCRQIDISDRWIELHTTEPRCWSGVGPLDVTRTA